MYASLTCHILGERVEDVTDERIDTMQVKTRRDMGRHAVSLQGLHVSVSPVFVADVMCASGGGLLVSILDPDLGQKEVMRQDWDDKFSLAVESNPKFVARIVYSFKNDLEDLHQHEVSCDSLVTDRLLDLTSYGKKSANVPTSTSPSLTSFLGPDSLNDHTLEPEMLATLAAPTSDDDQDDDLVSKKRMTFDEFYTNLSRKRILSKVTFARRSTA